MKTPVTGSSIAPRSILLHLGLPDRPPPPAPARGPPQAELDLDQTPAFDPSDGDPGLDFDFGDALVRQARAAWSA